MFQLIRLALQVVFKPYSLTDKTSCKKFIENILALVKPLAAQTKTELDDKLIQHLEYILQTDTLFDWFYKILVEQFSSDDVVFEDVAESEVVALLEQAAPEPMPEAISPLVIVSLVTQVISLINAIKKNRME